MLFIISLMDFFDTEKRLYNLAVDWSTIEIIEPFYCCKEVRKLITAIFLGSLSTVVGDL
ncbi:hypothetical protein GUT183_04320 [Streptococcus ruminantium]|nr:hypothetical protein GUT183_04320 [Streptococcus ruminantium]